MAAKLFDPNIVGTSEAAVEFVTSILQASTECSIIGKTLDGTIDLWNEGARRLYGYEPEEVVGTANASILHSAEDVAAGKPAQILAAALRTGKWEGTIPRRRKNGDPFTAWVVITPRLDSAGNANGFLLISKDISSDIRLTELEGTQVYTRSLFEANIDALMTTDALGIITDVNKPMESLTGYGRDALIGSPFKTYFTDPDRAEQGIKLALQRRRVTNYELTARAEDGRTTFVSYNASTLYDAEGKLQGVFAAARDITEQKKLEQQLRDSESYHRGLIESSNDGLIMVDPSGTINDVNARMCQMTGYSREELVGTAFAEYFLDPNLAAAGVRETFTSEVVTDYVLTLVKRDATQLRVSINASVFRDPDLKVRGIFASARDITEQAQLQNQLDEERTYNRGLIEASLDGLVTVDPMLNIMDVNETMCRMSGYSREELIGTPFPRYFTDGKRAAEGVRLTLDTGDVTNYELILLAPDHGERLVSFNAAIFRDPIGAVRGIFASARDITEQSRLQSLLAEERAYNRGLIEASVDGLITVDENMLITDVNDTMCRMVGLPRTQLLGSSFSSYFTERERAENGVALTFERGAVTNYVLTLRAADARKSHRYALHEDRAGGGGEDGEGRTGNEVPVSFNAAVFKDVSGKIRGIFASARDITAQKQLESQVQNLQFYTRSLIESNIDALMTTDSLGIISDVNQQMVVLTGQTRDELIGTPFKNYFTDPGRAEDGIRLVLRRGKVTNYTLTARAKDGRTTVVSYNAATFKDSNGQLQGVFAAARDITEQEKLEQQLREQQTYLRGLIESSGDGLVTVDPEGTITDVNERMCQMTGYTRPELIGTPFAQHVTDQERARSAVAETFEKGVVAEYSLTLVSRTRRELHVSFSASVFKDAADHVRGIFASARDITERLRLEEQLSEQQTYLRGQIDASVDGLVTVDPEGFITDVNEWVCRTTGYDRDRLIGSLFKDYFTDPARADAGVKWTLAVGLVSNYELVLVTKSGRKTTVSMDASIFRDAEGILQGIFASARDISEQARLQGKLAEQQAYNRSLVEASADALFVIAPDGIITDVSEEATRLTGYSRKHLVNSRFADQFTDAARAKAGTEKTLAEARVLDYELTLVTRQGRRVPVSFNAGVFTDSAGQPLGILAAARDITKQNALEQQLRDQQFYTRSLIEANIFALMATDPIGVITDVNKQMEALTGYSRDELLGSPFKKFFTEPDRAAEGVKSVLRDGNVTNFELTAISRDGAATEVSYNATTFYNREGNLEGVFAAARDVTERKHFEQALEEKSSEMENANLAKDRFLASMSHELRTPLNAIIGFTGVLLMKLAGPLTDDQEGQLRTVQASGRHLLSLINDLLDVAKIESGNTELIIEDIVCQDVVREVVETLLPFAHSKGLAFEVEVPAEAVVVRTDRRALSQILINFVNNAIKFTEQGSVTVVLARTDDEYGEARLSVRDTGPGLLPETQAQLFQAFRQLETGSTRRYEGTGLGLYLSKKLANLLGGTIDLESEPGKGSTFSLSFDESRAALAVG